MNTVNGPDAWELGDYARVLRRRWWVVLALAIAGTLIAGALVAASPRTYTAHASVYVAGLPTDAKPLAGGQSSVDMDTEAQLAGSPAVLALAASRLHGSGPRHLSSAVTATVPPNTTILDFACDASTAPSAAACANTVARAYLRVRLRVAAATVQSQLTAMKTRALALLPQVVRLDVQLHHLRKSTLTSRITQRLQARNAIAQLNSMLLRINSLSAELASLQAPDPRIAGRVVNVALPPSAPSSPRRALILPSGLVGGLIVGVILAFWLGLRDDRLYDPRDLDRGHGIPALFALSPTDLQGATAPAPLELTPPSPVVDLAEYLAATPSEGSLVVLVTGGSSETGIGLVAANLAAALSNVRPDVFLVCSAPGAVLAEQLLGAECENGLADVLSGHFTLGDVAHGAAGKPHLRVISPGNPSAPAAAGRTYDARRHLMAELRTVARYVIVEAPLAGAERAVFNLGEFADAAVVVVDAARTKRRELASWLLHLQRIRIPVLGAVMLPRHDRILRSESAASRLSPQRPAVPAVASALGVPAQTAGVAEQQGSQ